MILGTLKALFIAVMWAAMITTLLVGTASLLRDWDSQANRLTSITIGVERELGKLAKK